MCSTPSSSLDDYCKVCSSFSNHTPRTDSFIPLMDPRHTDNACDGSPFDMFADAVQRCPFLRNIRQPSSFMLPSPFTGTRAPIFEDGPNFEAAFRLFHGSNGVVPLLGRNSEINREPEVSTCDSDASNIKFHPLAASAAAISLSAFGASGPFSFDAFKDKLFNEGQGRKRSDKSKHQSEKKPSSDPDSSGHEAWSNEWLQTGNCPIAKSFRAVSGVLPMVAKMVQPPPGMKLRCPPAVMAARAALARTAAVKALRPQPLPSKVLAIGLLGMALNVPLGIWREHTEKFSPSWFIAVHASVPFVAMLRKAVNMPKYAMAFTIAASILGQVIGSRAERRRLELAPKTNDSLVSQSVPEVVVDSKFSNVLTVERPFKVTLIGDEINAFSSTCGQETWVSFEDDKANHGPVGAF